MVPESCPGRRDGRIHPFYLKIIKQLWFWGTDQAQEWTPLCPVLWSDSKGSKLPAHLNGVLPLDLGTELGCYFLPFSLAAWFMWDPFPLHQLLHCIGVDYWSDWVAFVSPRVFLFHCLFPPKTLGKKKTKQICLSLSNCSSAGQKQLHWEHSACLFLSHGWVQHNMLFWERT